ncbi:hypothetical protein TVAG_310210 [Trichomonas vaginalis G3]|uniref:Uncharacterized protein n=1 Tax=Trichomonas vaginalis (strain ATCC PRA-98 / G3) TaxID=412133 RepID=A2EKT7_TRIV3|nr:ift140/172-related cilium protein family [Trichomonas vaginalis G3]EAY06734.1 hypothetical protein TVAG_310210 [Trichomonas vaginalis G3]KAI5500974.1 ift140/172-related cilium protein family [Trichomonas vaginalis G3]|eukprot:XP_001318957.1 hypothetical protein [Trichomonas vaginalis G3]
MDYVHQEIGRSLSIKHISWSNSCTTCAVLDSSSIIHILNQRGEEIEDKVLNLLTSISFLSYSNISNKLAIGFSSGDLKIYHYSALFQAKLVHSAAISEIKWSPINEMFYTFDDSGCFCIWNCEGEIPELIVQKKFNISITNIQWLYLDKPSLIFLSKYKSLYLFESLYQEPDEILQIQTDFETVNVLRDNSIIFTTKEGEILTKKFPFNKNRLTTSKIGDGPVLVTQIDLSHIAIQTKGQIMIYNLENEESKIIRLKNEQYPISISYDPYTYSIISVLNDGSLYQIKSNFKGYINQSSWATPVLTDMNINVKSVHWSHNYENAIFLCENRPSQLIFRVYLSMAPLLRTTVFENSPGILNYADEKFNIAIGSKISKSDSSLLCSSPERCEIFMEQNNSFASISRFSCKSYSGMVGEAIYTVNEKNIEVRNLQGVVKQTVSLPLNSILFSLFGKYLTVLFEDYTINTYDLTRRQPKNIFSSALNFKDEKKDILIREMKGSCSGEFVSFIIDVFKDGIWQRDENLYIHIPQLDRTVTVNLSGRLPITCSWDEEDQRLLCIQASPKDISGQLKSEVIIPIFISNKGDIFLQQSFDIPTHSLLKYLNIPYVFLFDNDKKPFSQILPQFEGVDEISEDTKRAILDFNYNLCTGSIDDAFDSIKWTDNSATWRSLALIACQSDRIDLAALCLSKIKDPFSIIISKYKTDRDRSSILTAIALKLYNEAKSIAISSKRYDILSDIELSLGNFEESIRNSTLNARMVLKRVHYEVGRYNEIIGNYEKAIEHYNLSQTLENEIPRLAMSLGPQVVFDFLKKNPLSASNKIKLYCARYFEAIKNYEYALAMYLEAKNDCEHIRLLVLLKRWEDAMKFVKNARKPSDFCCLARYLIDRVEHIERSETENHEIAGELKQKIIELFKNAKQFGQAMKYAMEKMMIDDVIQLSFSSPKQLVLRAAEWFSSLNMTKNAILMYSHCGNISKALSLCFELKQYDALEEISEKFSPEMNPKILVQCSHYFAESDRWNSCAKCLLFAKKFDDVLDLCKSHHISLEEKEILSLIDQNLDENMYLKFAEICEIQQQNQLASKIYIKIRKYPEALQCIIKTGDTDKVIKMLKMMKKKDCYLICANYLQTLDIGIDSKEFRTVEEIYKKTNMVQNLFNFYNFHINNQRENGNYENVLVLLKKILENFQKSVSEVKSKSDIERSINVIDSFLIANNLCNDPETSAKSMGICVDMLKDPQIEEYVKTDDVYVVLAKCYITKNNFKSAFKIISDLESNGLELEKHFEIEVIRKVYEANGKKYEFKGDKNDYDSVEDIEDI